MQTPSHTPAIDAPIDGNDANLVALWCSVDKVRWAAGIVSGAIAGAFAMCVGGLAATAHGYEFLFPVKLMGTLLLGNSATALGNSEGLMAGIAVTGAISMLWGFVYGHFVRDNSLPTLIGMGFTWGAFSWVFIWNLLMHANKAIDAYGPGPGGGLLVCMAYGFGMSVIAIVDRAFRGSR